MQKWQSQFLNHVWLRARRVVAVAYTLILPILYAEGATALEFAIVLPILLLLVLGIVEYSIIMYASSVLDGALTTAAREGTTGYPDPNVKGTRQDYVYGIIQGRVSGLLDPTKLQISSVAFDNYSDVTPPPPCTTPPPPAIPVCHADVGDANQIVEYTVTYPWPLSTPLLRTIMDTTSDTFTISSSALVKNEPFSNAAIVTPPVGPDPGPVPSPAPLTVLPPSPPSPPAPAGPPAPPPPPGPPPPPAPPGPPPQ